MKAMIDSDETIILVDDQDRETGLAPKIEAHAQGLRHRAISVCVLDGRGRMLLQRRARDKYHSGRSVDQRLLHASAPGERWRKRRGVACAKNSASIAS